MKRLFNLVLVFFVALLFVSCDLLEDDSKSGPKAPDMGSPADLTISGVTGSPVDITECNDIFLDVVSAIQSGVMVNSTSTITTAPSISTSFSITGSRSSSRALRTDNGVISWIVGNSINVTGDETVSFFEDNRLTSTDPNYIPSNGNYDPTYLDDYTSRIEGSFNNATLSNINDYIVNGSIVRSVKSSVKQGVSISDSAMTSYFRCYDEKVLGSALSIVRADGVGAKFIFSYANAFSYSGDHNSPYSEVNAYANEISSSTIEVKVYDADDQLIFTSYLTLGEIGEFAFFL